MSNEVNRKKVVILGGGTVSHIRNHLALCAPAYGATAKKIAKLCSEHSDKLNIDLRLTKMADPNSTLETSADIKKVIGEIISDHSVKIVFFNVALVDYDGSIIENGERTASGKKEKRLETKTDSKVHLEMTPSEKLISLIRQERKDIFLIGFKTTCFADKQTMYEKGLNLVKKGMCNLVLVNDTGTYENMIITPEEAAYHETTDRDEVLRNLVEISYLRSHLTFTRSTVVAGDSVDWKSDLVPAALRTVVDHCIKSRAYKVFNGSTVGHFAVKLDDQTFLTSKRKTNFNDLDKIGLVKVKTDGPDTVIAYGAKPSVGGQSQRIVFNEHPGEDCIVHFHCPLKPGALKEIPIISQRPKSCGSHQCGEATSQGLKRIGNLWAVMLDNHGPNIVFNKNIDPQEVIDFIENNFELGGKTGGYIVGDR